MQDDEIRQIVKYYKFKPQKPNEESIHYRRALSDFLYGKGKIILAHEVIHGRYETSEETMNSLMSTVKKVVLDKNKQLPVADTGKVEFDNTIEPLFDEKPTLTEDECNVLVPYIMLFGGRYNV